jgi:hypothetical protein
METTILPLALLPVAPPLISLPSQFQGCNIGNFLVNTAAALSGFPSSCTNVTGSIEISSNDPTVSDYSLEVSVSVQAVLLFILQLFSSLFRSIFGLTVANIFIAASYFWNPNHS